MANFQTLELFNKRITLSPSPRQSPVGVTHFLGGKNLTLTANLTRVPISEVDTKLKKEYNLTNNRKEELAYEKTL